jgi:hypothetical protein
MTKKLIDSLRLDKDLVLEFFFVFSRFESALKQASFLTKKSYAAPDWTAFANSCNKEFEAEKCGEFLNAVRYLDENPPQRQVAETSKGKMVLKFANEGKPKGSKSQVTFKRICCVRNNLFHGGKFDPTINEVERNTSLLEHSLVILKRASRYDNKVWRYFRPS